MPELTHEQTIAIDIAHNLADMGAPIFAAHRNSLTGDFLYPNEWQHTKPGDTSHRWIDRWRPGMALCMVTGVLFDVLDIDPRNGGIDGIRHLIDEELNEEGPHVYGNSRTPSGGEHALIGRTHLAKGKPAQGVDLQAGADDGTGRGFVFIAPTVRMSKWGPRAGQEVAYEWLEAPFYSRPASDPGLAALIDLCRTQRAPRRMAVPAARTAESVDDPFDTVAGWTAAEADRVIIGQCEAVRAARAGEVNNALGGAARVLGRFVAGGYLDEDRAVAMLLDELDLGGVHSDSWNVANGKGWTARTCIGAGLARGAEEPWSVEPAAIPNGGRAQEAAGSTDQQPANAASGTIPPLMVESAATMAYWLQSTLGSGTLSGFFMRNGQVVHTPLVDEVGYVAPRNGKDDDNGPAQIQAVTAATLAAKIQYAHRCYKVTRDKETKQERETPALFPLQAAQRAVDAPEAMGMLRGLRGLTHTPMVRADGSLLAQPGYDAASRYLFLPGPGVRVADVADVPDVVEVQAAVALLDEMVAGFPFESDDDRANYYGLLLTPLLRQLAPPSYKMFGIGAHQPGSGKTLLADIATILHGGVLRSEMPEDEPEMRKQITSILSTTSAPIVHVDNVTGVLRSPTLAGLLTAGQPTQDRELGSSKMIETVNDRVWVVTGNNLSLGGDLVRRTIIITIDPNMPSPETRQFAIADLKGWVAERRNDLLHALLTMIRNWVAVGSLPAARRQSDSFAAWESVVAGILRDAGVPGAFDAESGKRAAAGGDDDGIAQVLEHVWAVREGGAWTVGELLDGHGGDIGDFVVGSREWLPSPVLDKMARSEAAGRKSFGHWLRNRVGRWVTGSDGRSYVIREAGTLHRTAVWKVERTS